MEDREEGGSNMEKDEIASRLKDLQSVFLFPTI
jgi:hypothetical protein